VVEKVIAVFQLLQTGHDPIPTHIAANAIPILCRVQRLGVELLPERMVIVTFYVPGGHVGVHLQDADFIGSVVVVHNETGVVAADFGETFEFTDDDVLQPELHHIVGPVQHTLNNIPRVECVVGGVARVVALGVHGIETVSTLVGLHGLIVCKPKG